MREIGAVEVGELLLDIHISVEIDIAVRWMIVTCMEVEEHLLREPGDCIGIAARLAAVCRIGVERRHDAAAE